MRSVQYKRQGKDGKPLWVQATYYPILDSFGTPRKVIKHTIDVTTQMLERANGVGQLAGDQQGAGRSGARARRHGHRRRTRTSRTSSRLFGSTSCAGVITACSSTRATRDSSGLPHDVGQACARRIRRRASTSCIAKDGREIWVQASFNPILDAAGKPFKIVEYATDVTQQLSFSEQLRAVVRETRAVVSAAAAGDLRPAHFASTAETATSPSWRAA